MSDLLNKQQQFSRMIERLLKYAHDNGYEVTFGDAFRDERAFGHMGERKCYGQAKSAHKQRLAIDLNLFKNDEPLSETKDHESLGIFWEGLGGTWGGRFEDGNHYSLEYNGIK